MDTCLGVLPTSPEQIVALRSAFQTGAAYSIAYVISCAFVSASVVPNGQSDTTAYRAWCCTHH